MEIVLRINIKINPEEIREVCVNGPRVLHYKGGVTSWGYVVLAKTDSPFTFCQVKASGAEPGQRVVVQFVQRGNSGSNGGSSSRKRTGSFAWKFSACQSKGNGRWVLDDVGLSNQLLLNTAQTRAEELADELISNYNNGVGNETLDPDKKSEFVESHSELIYKELLEERTEKERVARERREQIRKERQEQRRNDIPREKRRLFFLADQACIVREMVKYNEDLSSEKGVHGSLRDYLRKAHDHRENELERLKDIDFSKCFCCKNCGYPNPVDVPCHLNCGIIDPHYIKETRKKIARTTCCLGAQDPHRAKCNTSYTPNRNKRKKRLGGGGGHKKS